MRRHNSRGWIAYALGMTMVSVSCSPADSSRTAVRADGTLGSVRSSAEGTLGSVPLVYVSNEGSDNISIVDTHKDSVVSTIFVGKRPRGIRVSPDGKTILSP